MKGERDLCKYRVVVVVVDGKSQLRIRNGSGGGCRRRRRQPALAKKWGGVCCKNERREEEGVGSSRQWEGKVGGREITFLARRSVFGGARQCLGTGEGGRRRYTSMGKDRSQSGESGGVGSAVTTQKAEILGQTRIEGRSKRVSAQKCVGVQEAGGGNGG